MTEEEFYQKIPTWIGADRSTWNHITLFAYFCHKYHAKSGINFKMVRSRSGPTSTKETRDFSKLIKIFCSDNYESLDKETQDIERAGAINKVFNYINWMFDFKYRNAPAVSGTQVFLVPSLINEFERMYAAKISKQTKNNSLDIFMEWIRSNYPSVLDNHQLETSNDVMLFSKYVENSKRKNSDYIKIVERARELNIL